MDIISGATQYIKQFETILYLDLHSWQHNHVFADVNNHKVITMDENHIIITICFTITKLRTFFTVNFPSLSLNFIYMCTQTRNFTFSWPQFHARWETGNSRAVRAMQDCQFCGFSLPWLSLVHRGRKLTVWMKFIMECWILTPIKQLRKGFQSHLKFVESCIWTCWSKFYNWKGGPPSVGLSYNHFMYK